MRQIHIAEWEGNEFWFSSFINELNIKISKKMPSGLMYVLSTETDSLNGIIIIIHFRTTIKIRFIVTCCSALAAPVTL